MIRYGLLVSFPIFRIGKEKVTPSIHGFGARLTGQLEQFNIARTIIEVHNAQRGMNEFKRDGGDSFGRFSDTRRVDQESGVPKGFFQ
jgi:hypothetical protein